MIIRPKTRGFVCVTAHPDGCAQHVQEQIDFVQQHKSIERGPKRSLIIGASTGYGLASRIVSAFGCGASTFGVFYERPTSNGRPASAGWYNMAAFTEKAKAAGLYAGNINGDAFTEEIRSQTIQRIKEEMGPVDEVIYSLAAPRRTDPQTGETYKSVLKPVGQDFTAKTVDTDKDVVHDVHIEAATEDEIESTRKVMGGEDWVLWIEALSEAGLLADGCQTVAYSYIGPKVTWPVYRDGTIGKAKEHLYQTAHELNQRMQSKGGRAMVSVNKAVVTQASSAIPVVPLYLSALIRILSENNLDEDCIHQIHRLYSEHLYADSPLRLDEENRVRMDDIELREDIQLRIEKLWPELNTENLREWTSYDTYKAAFLKLFGFGLSGVDYDADVSEQRDIPDHVNP